MIKTKYRLNGRDNGAEKTGKITSFRASSFIMRFGVIESRCIIS